MNDKLNTASAGAQKLLTWTDELDAWNAGLSFAPVQLEIHPTERCNHSCPDCQAHYAIGMHDTRNRARDGVDLDLSLLESIWGHAPPGIVLSGNTGDPLMHPEYNKLINTLHSWAPESKVLLITNGQAFKYKSITNSLRACQAIRVSLDADGPKMYRMTHGTKADWAKTMASLVALRYLRDETGHECQLGVGYLTDCRTVAGMYGAAKLARDCGMDSIQFRPFHYRAEHIDEQIERCRELETDDFKVLVSWQKYDNVGGERQYTSCQGANFVYLLDARGDFYMCCHHVGNPAAKLGSLHDVTWQEFVRSEQRRRKVDEFNVSGCLPLCRLNTQNEMLHELALSYEVPDVNLPAAVEEQRCFL